ncbi:hypothetical protein CDAR_18181 [Caerostris darwini]|uniref:Uncharacterized protein n=1 Tax=Caerostris darwini TaxID=1538125 RepID=A0AAV4R2M1_9ARAC|nr:hypothetical protein CDAR_18181 [Caerostris darwini]
MNSYTSIPQLTQIWAEGIIIGPIYCITLSESECTSPRVPQIISPGKQESESGSWDSGPFKPAGFFLPQFVLSGPPILLKYDAAIDQSDGTATGLLQQENGPRELQRFAR